MIIRQEQFSDRNSIGKVILAAFAAHPHSQGNEQDIVDALRAAQALTVSLVAVEGDEVVGHIACSPVSINDELSHWFGLGPVAVRPDRQSRGIGAALVRAAIDQLRARNAEGIVLLGEPSYYQRFGFTARPELQLPGAPASHFLALPLRDRLASGVVMYHTAFDV
jgi:putative acetyltransferase